MGNIITVNPVTRISGFLEIKVEIENKIVVDAKSSGLLFRGFEKMLRNRPPLDAIYFTERICGICSTAHSMCSTLALEDTTKIEATENDRIIRDYIHGCEFLQNHLRHFYQFTLPDFVKGPEISPLYDAPHEDYRLPKEENNLLAAHYLESLKYSRLAHEMLATLGGKAPHNHGIFVGGVTINIDASEFNRINSILKKIKSFVVNKMIPDVYIIAKYYSDYYQIGGGYKNLMSYGVFDYPERDIFYVAPGVYIDGKNEAFNENNITENIYRAWYEADRYIRKPTDSTVDEETKKEGAYSWVKAPRYEGYAMEVGPLARMWLSGEYNRGISTMDRTIARVLEVNKIIDIMEGLLEKIRLQPSGQSAYKIPEQAVGRGLIDTTRGALGHWISINNSTIKNYEIITPSAWNLSPEDSNGMKGTVERALIGTRIENETYPVEIGRIVRSFDPCISCATHIVGSKFEPVKIKVI